MMSTQVMSHTCPVTCDAFAFASTVMALDRRQLASLVKSARERAGLTQAKLAEDAGITDETVSRLERGAYEPSLATILAIARALGTTVEALTEVSSSASGARRGQVQTVDLGKLAPDSRRIVTRLIDVLESKDRARPRR